MTKVLTEEFLKEKYAYTSKNLKDLKLINIWGKDIEDISVLSKFQNLETICLSCNNISDISPLQNCHALKELYLRKNKIKDLNQLLYLKNLPNLNILWISDNPIAQIENYRYFVEKNLSQVKNLDHFPTINYLCKFINEDEHKLIVTLINNLKKQSIHTSLKNQNENEKKNHLGNNGANDKPVLPRRSISNSNVLSLINNNHNFQKFLNSESSQDKQMKRDLEKEDNQMGKINFVCKDKLNHEEGKYNKKDKLNPKSDMSFMKFDFKSCKNVVKLAK